jgi:integrase
VYKHGKKWRFDFTKNHERFIQDGFPTKIKAMEAEEKAKLLSNRINKNFLTLCRMRLNELKIYRTSRYVEENRKLLDRLVDENESWMWHRKKVITRQDVKLYLFDVASRSKTMANKELKFLKALFNFGIKEDMIIFNPADGIERFGVDVKQKYIPPMEHVKRVLEIARPMEKLYLEAIIHTMARVREINRLKWEDVYEEHLVLRTRKARHSDWKERKIPFNNSLKRVLSEVPKIGEYVFVHPTTLERYKYRSKLLKKLCEKAGVKPDFNYHALRHYGASKLAAEGVALTTIQSLLGHSRSTTTDVYLQALRGSEKEAVGKLEF